MRRRDPLRYRMMPLMSNQLSQTHSIRNSPTTRTSETRMKSSSLRFAIFLLLLIASFAHAGVTSGRLGTFHFQGVTPM